jgi:glycosyltransferase involved in cell wall biosynthesis
LSSVRAGRGVRVAIDATPLLDVRTGVGTFVHELLHHLPASVDPIAYALTRRYLGDVRPLLPECMELIDRPIGQRSSWALWQRGSWPPIERWTGPVDVVHGTNSVVPPARGGAALVTVHDLTPLRYPELCDHLTVRYPALLRAALRRGAHVHTVSRFVGEEVQEAFGLPAERVHVVPNGAAPRPPGDAAAGRRAAGAERYVLAIGTVEPRKGYDLLVRAFDQLAERVPDVGLVIVGRTGWRTEAFDAAMAAARSGGRIRRLGYAPDTGVADLLAGASVLAFPSAYEGFGLPPLEAMLAGVPVVAAPAGAVPEVVGDAALVVDREADAWAAALEQILTDDALAACLAAAGPPRAAAFTWERTAADLAEVYRSLS